MAESAVPVPAFESVLGDPQDGSRAGIEVERLQPRDTRKTVPRLAVRLRVLEVRQQRCDRLGVETECGAVGYGEADVPALVSGVRALSHLTLSGLMVIPPFDDDEAARACYRTLRALAGAHGLSQLSMGMSDDFELAIAEGSTSVRVGTAIFGPRTP